MNIALQERKTCQKVFRDYTLMLRKMGLMRIQQRTRGYLGERWSTLHNTLRHTQKRISKKHSNKRTAKTKEITVSHVAIEASQFIQDSLYIKNRFLLTKPRNSEFILHEKQDAHKELVPVVQPWPKKISSPKVQKKKKIIKPLANTTLWAGKGESLKANSA